jgi:predicted DNA-binding ribbon-helix-helix protein
VGRGTACLTRIPCGVENSYPANLARSIIRVTAWKGRGDPASSFEQRRRQHLSGLIKRSFSLAGHRTSVALEAAFWDVLDAIARSRGVSLGGLVASVDSGRDGTTPLASCLRVLALQEALGRLDRVSPAPPDP